MMLTPFVLPTFFVMVHHRGAILTDLDVFRGNCQHQIDSSSVRRHAIQFRLIGSWILSVAGKILSYATEQNGSIVCRKGIREFIIGMEGQPGSFSSFGIHGEHV